MRAALALLAVIVITASGVAVAQDKALVSPAPASAASFPAWAYPWAPDFKVPPDDGQPTHVPDSTQSFTIAQERNLFFVPDWHPQDHPPMPDVVAHGRQPDVRACGSCHRADRRTRPRRLALVDGNRRKASAVGARNKQRDTIVGNARRQKTMDGSLGSLA